MRGETRTPDLKRKEIVLPATVACRTGKKQIAPGVSEPPISMLLRAARRPIGRCLWPVVLDVVISSRNLPFAVATLESLGSPQDRIDDSITVYIV